MIRLRAPIEGRQSALSTLYDSAGMKIIMEIMEDACTEAENDLIGEIPWSETVQAKQAVAYAQRAFLIRVMESIDYHVAELRGDTNTTPLVKRLNL